MRARRNAATITLAVVLGFVSVTSGTGDAFAEEAEAPRRWNNIRGNPLGVLVGGLSATYSRAVWQHMTIDVSATYLAPVFVPFHGLGGELGLSFWITRPHAGAFITPFLQVTRSFATNGDAVGIFPEGRYLDAMAVAPGLLAGYRWLWDGGLNLGLGAGAGWAFAVWSEACPAGYACSLSGEGIVIRLLLDLGYAF
jgi:hypothetical protein